MANKRKRPKVPVKFNAQNALASLDGQWKGLASKPKEKIKGIGMNIVRASFVKIWAAIELLENILGRKAGIKPRPNDPLHDIVNDLADAKEYTKKIVTMLLQRSSHREKTALIHAIGQSLNIPKSLGPKQSPDASIYVYQAARKLLQVHIDQKRGVPTLADIRHAAEANWI